MGDSTLRRFTVLSILLSLVNVAGAFALNVDSIDIRIGNNNDAGFEFFFPAGSPVTMADGERILLVKNLTAFSSEFVAPGATQIFEWGPDGSLSNSGEKIQLSMPGDVDGSGVRQYIRIDRVNYSDGSHPLDFPKIGIDPWPAEPDGNGKSLTRIVNSNYGNDPINWQSADPTPGQ
jgi:hypothetical protein